VEFEGGLPRDDGLDEQDEGVDGIAEAVEDEELEVVGREAQRIDGVVD